MGIRDGFFENVGFDRQDLALSDEDAAIDISDFLQETTDSVDCYANWLAWLGTLSPYHRAEAEEEGADCPHTIPGPFWDGTNGEWAEPFGEPLIVPGPCADSLHEAACPQPSISPANPSGMLSLGLQGHSGRFVVGPGDPIPGSAEITQCVIDLIRRAFRLLEDNRALVNWALCMVNPDWGNCVWNRITANSNPVNISFRSGLGGLAKGSPVYGIRLDAENMALLGAIECCGDDESRVCATIQVASAMFHELIHVCGRDFNDSEGECGQAYLAENLLLWSLFNRYPSALVSSCCTAFADRVGRSPGSLYGDDFSSVIGANCVPDGCNGRAIPRFFDWTLGGGFGL